jgi:hypothetical protein
MIKRELDRRLAALQTYHALEAIQIHGHDAAYFEVRLTSKQNVPASDQLIRQLEETLGGALRSLLLLRSGAAVLRFTVPRDATGDETDSDRVQETMPTFYGEPAWARPLRRATFFRDKEPACISARQIAVDQF